MKNASPNVLTAALVVTAAIGTAAPAQAVNLFVNGGFETPGTTTPAEGWTPAAEGYTLTSDARTGDFALQLSSPALNAAVALQNSAESGGIAVTPGDSPELSFWAKGFVGDTGNVLFALSYLDEDGTILAGTGNQFFPSQINPNTFTEITAAAVVVPEGAVSAFIEFSHQIGPIGVDPPSGTTFLPGTVIIDDIVLAGVPEPASLALLGLGGAAALLRRRRIA